jgi:hypothetical protein
MSDAVALHFNKFSQTDHKFHDSIKIWCFCVSLYQLQHHSFPRMKNIKEAILPLSIFSVVSDTLLDLIVNPAHDTVDSCCEHASETFFLLPLSFFTYP